MKHERSLSISLPGIVSAGWLVMLLGCTNNDDIAAWSYVCGNEAPLPTEDVSCGAADIAAGQLPPEPYHGPGEQWPPPIRPRSASSRRAG